jgi:hypothetical protein
LRVRKVRQDQQVLRAHRDQQVLRAHRDQRAFQAHRDQRVPPDRRALRANRVPKVIREPPGSLNNDHRTWIKVTEPASVGGLFHFKPSNQCR